MAEKGRLGYDPATQSGFLTLKGATAGSVASKLGYDPGTQSGFLNLQGATGRTVVAIGAVIETNPDLSRGSVKVRWSNNPAPASVTVGELYASKAHGGTGRLVLKSRTEKVLLGLGAASDKAGKIELFKDGKRAVYIDGETSTIALYNGSGGKTVNIDGRFGTITLYDLNGKQTFKLDGGYGNMQQEGTATFNHSGLGGQTVINGPMLRMGPGEQSYLASSEPAGISLSGSGHLHARAIGVNSPLPIVPDGTVYADGLQVKFDSVVKTLAAVERANSAA